MRETLILAVLSLALCASPSSALLGDCCQPLTEGPEPLSSDSLHILRAAVDLVQCDPECACQPRGEAMIAASDALLCLKHVVGQPVSLDCPCDTTTTTSTTFTTTSTTTTLSLDLPETWEEAFDASEVGWMMAAWGPGDGGLWVVGGALDNGRIFRQGPGGWSEVVLDFQVPLLTWVHGTSRHDVFAGGYNGTILHYDGTTWTKQTTPATDPVWGVWAVAPDDVWAVGGEGFSMDPPFILRYDGSEWRNIPVPTLVRPGVRAFFKMWASGADDLYIVGQGGAALHWNGATFTELFLGVSQDLIGIWGTGPDNIVAVGGRGTAEIVRYDGEEWTKAPSSPLPGLNGVWLGRPDVAHAVGVAGTSVLIDPETLSVTEDPIPSSLEIHGVFGDRQGQLLALGANFSLPETGVALIRELQDDE